jgi:hypothetical protein
MEKSTLSKTRVNVEMFAHKTAAGRLLGLYLVDWSMLLGGLALAVLLIAIS